MYVRVGLAVVCGRDRVWDGMGRCVGRGVGAKSIVSRMGSLSTSGIGMRKSCAFNVHTILVCSESRFVGSHSDVGAPLDVLHTGMSGRTGCRFRGSYAAFDCVPRGCVLCMCGVGVTAN